MSRHWADELFLKRPELFGKVLESFIPQAAAEAEWIAKLFQAHGIESASRILDLACGIGRHSLQLAGLGYRVTGVDLSPEYIARAKELAKKRRLQQHTKFVIGDMRQLAQVLAGARFDAVINLFTSFGFYDERTDLSVLRQCRELARAKGLFLIDLINRDWLAKNFQTRGFNRFADILFLEERTLHQETGRINSRWTILREISPGEYRQEAIVTIDHRVYTLHELIDLCKGAGWAYQEAYGSLTGAPFEVASRRIVALFVAS